MDRHRGMKRDRDGRDIERHKMGERERDKDRGKGIQRWGIGREWR